MKWLNIPRLFCHCSKLNDCLQDLSTKSSLVPISSFFKRKQINKRNNPLPIMELNFTNLITQYLNFGLQEFQVINSSNVIFTDFFICYELNFSFNQKYCDHKRTLFLAKNEK
ncbi:hypothetical protein BpHYR1_039764 [Brachionus plicatilis]|uniref:Uncharacterized protein n=1 Tax=Brachionus plicatilis TaxID=10195 RepID=A0A3M7SKY0_BRAPC|nr:hypothetical protein BpHYR1_039764 [Brachionus plicatilis]